MKFARPEFLLFSFLLWGCSPGRSEPVLGSVFQIQGSVVVTHGADGTNAHSLSMGDKFSPPDDIRVNKESVAVFCLTPGIYLRAFSETQLKVIELGISKDGNETGYAMRTRRASIEFGTGRLHVFLPAAGPSRAELHIQSRLGAVTAKAGSLFSIAWNGEAMRVLCVQGEINWSAPPSFSVSIPAGYFLDCGSGSSENLKLAADDSKAQQEITAVLESAQAIVELEDASRNAPAPWRK